MKLSSDEERSEDVDRNAVNGPSHVPQLNLSSLHEAIHAKPNRSSLVRVYYRLCMPILSARQGMQTIKQMHQGAKLHEFVSHPLPDRSPRRLHRISPIPLDLLALENWQQSMESGALKSLLVDVQEVLHAAIYLPASKMESEFSTSSSSPSETEELSTSHL
ncbi:hypothetical protein GQ600_17803 [Phytophthora cactorum]|nr:hypothetical protein GQ600_17803 [Phytophthora cactorum]